jgi:leucine dehydrogenase
VLFESLDSVGLRKLVVVSDPPSGLRALIAIDDTTLGPAAGGVRTRVYQDEWSALREVAGLARTMTLKCALAGLQCGGGKAVVLDHPGLDRPRAFEILGAAVESLGGLFRTAGDLGTHEADLRAMERRTRYVSLDAQGLDLEGSTARGVVLAMGEAASIAGTDLATLDVLVQGVGAIGAAVAAALVERGAHVAICDVDRARVAAFTEQFDVRVVDPAEATRTPCDVFAPCAVGDVLDAETARSIPCKIVCGAANNPLTDESVADVLAARGVLYVPDFVANAGAVIDGMGRSVMELQDRSHLIERIGDTTRHVFEQARERGVSTLVAARTLAYERIEEAMPKWRRSG